MVRGGAGPIVPLNADRVPTASSFTGDLAVGRYFRPHDVPFGDLVVYAACNFNAPFQAGSQGAYAGAGPGTRFHLGRDFYFLHYWEFALTGPHPQDYTTQTGLLKLF